jgi:hypothetical protein
MQYNGRGGGVSGNCREYSHEFCVDRKGDIQQCHVSDGIAVGLCVAGKRSAQAGAEKYVKCLRLRWIGRSGRQSHAAQGVCACGKCYTERHNRNEVARSLKDSGS